VDSLKSELSDSDIVTAETFTELLELLAQATIRRQHNHALITLRNSM
jgi:hypothetical protein